MGQVDQLLAKLHRLYHDPAQRLSFVEEVADLAQTIGKIFSFSSTLLVIDHLDLLNLSVNRINLLDVMNTALDRCQYLVSGLDCSSLLKLRSDWWIVSVTDTCRSEFRDCCLNISFKNRRIGDLRIDSRICGGCPSFVDRFDDICGRLQRLDGFGQTVKRDETRIVINTKTEILLDLVMSFGDQTEKDGGPPLVSGVRLRNKPR
jgi:hypothetical protein